MRVPRWAQFLALFMLASFTWVSLSENFVHHHHSQQEEQDCAYCQFHKTVSNADISTAPLHLIPLFAVFFVVFALSTSEIQFVFRSHSSRGPPFSL